MKKLLRIYIFVESAYQNESLHHAIEHRFFEHDSIRVLENGEHTELSAYAHITGILFKIKTIKYSKQEILDIYDKAFSEVIPMFSEGEQMRFLQEEKERSFDRGENFVELTGRQFKSELESPILGDFQYFSDFLVRKSFVINENGNLGYSEVRYKNTVSILPLKQKKIKGKGKEFHLISLRKIHNLADVFYEAIYTEYIRDYLKKLYCKTGLSYDIWINTYYEAGYLYTGYYWLTDSNHVFEFYREELNFDETSFLHNKNIVRFDTIVGHEESLFSLNVILGVDPNKELENIDSLTYEGFIHFMNQDNFMDRLYVR